MKPIPEPTPRATQLRPARRRDVVRVLILEDDVSVAELCRRILVDEGYACTISRDVAAAREAIAANEINLIIADVVLPGGATGRDLEGEARSAGIAVLFMSGDYVALRELADARIAHLRKPFRLSELVVHVRNALRGVREAVPDTR